jgi:hypothetical protein
VNELDRIKQGKVKRNRQEATHVWDKGRVSLLSMEMFPSLREHYPFFPRQSVSLKEVMCEVWIRMWRDVRSTRPGGT